MTFEEYFSWPFIFSAIVLVLTLVLVRIWNYNRTLPPGPWGLPLLGYYPFLSPKLYLDFAQLAKKYGDVFSFRTVGGKLIIVLSGSKRIKEVLVSRSDEFIGRPLEVNLLRWISDGLGVIQEEGSSWTEHRRFFLHTVKNYGFGKIELEEKIHEEIRNFLSEMRQTRGEATNFDIPLSYAISNIVCHVLFARKMDKEKFPNLINAMHVLIQIFGDNRFMLVGPFFQYVAMKFSPWSAKIRQARQIVKSTFHEIIDDHVQNYDPDNQKDYVDSYLHQIQKLKASGDPKVNSFTIERLKAISMNMAMEGTETVADAILDLLYEMGKHPAEQKLAQEELDAVIGKDRLPSWLDRHKLKYVEAFIEELNRTAMSFYISTHYSNLNETTINGFLIPKRSILVMNFWTINNDPEYFPEPEKFDVGRYLGEDGKKIRTEGPYPFGLGKRDCVGQSLGRMEVFLFIASILQNFTLLSGKEEGRYLKAIPRN